MSVRIETVLGGTTTQLQGVDTSRGIASVRILQTTILKKYVTNTRTMPQTMTVYRDVVTAIIRTWTLSYGNLNTNVIQTIPTRIVVRESTQTVSGSVPGGSQMTPGYTQPIPI